MKVQYYILTLIFIFILYFHLIENNYNVNRLIDSIYKNVETNENVNVKNGIDQKKTLTSQSKTVRHVFFDIGVNNGDSLLKFFNQKNRGIVGGNLIYSSFGPAAQSAKWIVYAFEANPTFNDILSNITDELSKKHTIYLYNQTAAWTYDGTVDFYLDTVNKNYDYWGSSLDKDHPDVKKSNSTKLTVQCKDIAAILKQYTEDDFIVLKMDIEGAEYDMLLDFIKKDVLKLIDYIAIEYHTYLSKIPDVNSLFNKIISLYGVKQVAWN